MVDVRQWLAADDPLDFLAFVSSIVANLDPRGKSPFERAELELTMPEFVESLAREVMPETTALLAALSELGPDEETRRRARLEWKARPYQLPDWLTRLDETSVYRAVESTEVLGDANIVLLGARLLETELTVLLVIDHNSRTVVVNGSPIPLPIADVAAKIDNQDLTVRDIGLADARARVEDAIAKGAMMFPPLKTDSWPISRPLAEWLARLMPAGGSGYVRPEWSEAAKAELAERFFASELGSPLDDEDRRGLLSSLLWFGTDYGPGDPLRWSPAVVEILLADWIPRKLIEEPEYLSKAPGLLRAYVRFCHAERGIRPALTEQTLAVVDAHEEEYQRVIRSSRPQGPEARAR